VLLLVTGVANCMSKAAIHIECVGDALHRVSEPIRILYANVDKLVAKETRISAQYSARIEMFKNKTPDTPP
jgi:hypothetical protein